MNINENKGTNTLKEETDQKIKIKNLINLIITANENAEIIYKLIELEKNEIELISNLLEILSDFNNCLLNLTPTQNLYILIYIKNILPKYKAKPKMKQIKNLEDKILKGINFYLNFDFSKKYTIEPIFEKIKKFLDEIIPFLFEFIIVMEKPKNFLLNVYNNIISSHLNNSTNIFGYEEFFIKFIFIYENFCRIYLIYVFKNEEINIIFEKYYLILKLCNINSNLNSPETKGKKYLQCILSFSKTTILSLDHFIKTKILNISSEIVKNKDNNERFNFMNSKYIFKFIKYCFYLNEKENNFSLNLEYFNENTKKFDLLLCKGKGVLIELLTVIIKKLSKFEFFNNYIESNSKICEYFCNITEYLIIYYKKGIFPREKALNNPEEIIQLTTIVKALNFMEEILDNKIYHELIDNNNFSINIKNKYEKYSDIFKYIIVPNLIRTDLEKTYFDFNQNEYIQNLFDMNQNCQIKIPKQQSIKLLITMCENIDEFLSYIVHAYVYVLKNISLNYNEKEYKNIKIEQKYENLYYFLLNNIDKFNLFEQALQVLTSLFSLYCDKYYLSEFFCDEIDIINYMLIKINDPFLKSKLCNFYSVSLEILFHNENEVLSKSFDDSLNFIFECIFSKIPSLQKTAFNCLNQIIFNNYLKKFCATSVHIYTLKIVNYFNEKENLEGYEDEFNDFLRGIVKEYMFDLDDSTIQLFDLFWNKFCLILQKNINGENKINNNNNIILKDKTKEVNEAVEISNQINIINKFIKNISNKNIEIKNNIYEKILNLFQYLKSYINTDFEEEILELILKIILDVKLLPNIYFQYFLNFLNCFNQDNNYYYKMENYHVNFIFTCIQSFKIDLILNGNIKEILIKQLSYRLLQNRRSIPLKKIFEEHYIYCDLGLCINIHFFGDLNKENIIDLISIYFQRMEKIPNTDYELNIKLCINIFILLIKIDNYEIYDEIFLINKKVDLYTFINKVISFFPYVMLSVIEQQIISIFCSLIIRYLILKQKNNQEVLLCDKNDIDIFDNNYEKIYFFIFYLNLNQLNLIKQRAINDLKRFEKREEMKNTKNNEKLIILNPYDINENNKAHFKNNKDMIYSEREPHNKSIIDKSEKKENNVYDDSMDYFSNDDEFLIIREYNKQYNNENNSEDEEYIDENVEDLNEENSKDDDDRDENFITMKKDNKNFFLNYYNKFANEKLVVSLREINEFKLFELMMKDLELNNKNTLINIYDEIKRRYGNEKLELIEKYKGIQKIYFPDKNMVSYRKIVKIVNNNIFNK